MAVITVVPKTLSDIVVPVTLPEKIVTETPSEKPSKRRLQRQSPLLNPSFRVKNIIR